MVIGLDILYLISLSSYLSRICNLETMAVKSTKNGFKISNVLYKRNYLSKGLSKKATLKQKPTFFLSALIPTYGTETVNLKL